LVGGHAAVIEGENAGLPANRPSCTTCHDLSSVKSDGITLLQALPADPIGFPQPLPSKDWIRDFAWSLLLACPSANLHFNRCAP
jgi:hypothetical protein